MTKCSATPCGEGGNGMNASNFVRLVRGISGNIEKVKGKGNAAPNTLEGNENKDIVSIARNNPND
jgi:hypothetical protein